MSTWRIDDRVAGSPDPLPEELADLRREGYSVLVSLLDEEEEPPLCPPARAREMGFTRYGVPITDFSAPTLEQMRAFVSIVTERHPDEKVIVHCHAGLGRTGTMGAALLVAQGCTANEAIARIRAVQPYAIVTAGQEEAVRSYAAWRATGTGDIDE